MTYHIFDIITEINESRILTNHLSCKCEYKFDCRKCNPNQKWNNDECQCECENPKEYNACKKIMFGILIQVVVKKANI